MLASVIIKTTIKGVDFNLMSTITTSCGTLVQQMQSKIGTRVKKALPERMDVLESDITVELSAGSVIAATNIRMPTEANALKWKAPIEKALRVRLIPKSRFAQNHFEHTQEGCSPEKEVLHPQIGNTFYTKWHILTFLLFSKNSISALDSN